MSGCCLGLKAAVSNPLFGPSVWPAPLPNHIISVNELGVHLDSETVSSLEVPGYRGTSEDLHKDFKLWCAVSNNIPFPNQQLVDSYVIYLDFFFFYI